MTLARPPVRPRNDLRQYDDLAEEWWDERGEFAALHWLADARAALVPAADRADAVLLDVGCGGGLMGPRVRGYRHVGIDLVSSALELAAQRDVQAIRADAGRIPLGDATCDVVVAGEVLEHVADVTGVVAEVCRVLMPGGTVVIDTIADTAWARFSLVTIGERLPGGPPRRCHDPALFVDPRRLQSLFAAGGVRLRVRGLQPEPFAYARFVMTRRGSVTMRPTRSLAAIYQGVGTKGRS